MQCVYSAQNSWLLSQGYPGLGGVDKDMEPGLIKQTANHLEDTKVDTEDWKWGQG